MTKGRVAVVGGGFYGCVIACHMAELGWPVVLLEREPALMTRASYVNQARLHNGYHYPRSFRTAIRSRANLPVFLRTYGDAIDDGFRMLYAIARFSSNIDGMYFRQFCRAAGCRLEPATQADRQLFDARLVQDVFVAAEPAFNARVLCEIANQRLRACDVDVRCGAEVTAVVPAGGAGSGVVIRAGDAEIAADWVFNCTYSALNHIDGRPGLHRPSLLHRISEVVLVEPPPRLEKVGITVMDGPFFSCMPFPARGLHSLTHVRHTHHLEWVETGTEPEGYRNRNPLDILSDYLAGEDAAVRRSRAPWMIRDSKRFVPLLEQVRVVDRLYEVKSLVPGTEFDDARPIYFHRDQQMPNVISILGGKIDNVFDILTYIDEIFDGTGTRNAAG